MQAIDKNWRDRLIFPVRSVRQTTFLWHRLVQVTTVVFVAIILIMRGDDRFWNPQFWFEDGPIYLQDAYNLPFWESLVKPHFHVHAGTGYYVTLNRLGAEFALLFNIYYTPAVFMLFAFIIALITSIIFVSEGFSWFISSVVIRAFFCLLIAALPASYEILLRFLNVQWYLGILAFLLVLIDPPQRKLGKITYILSWFVLAISNPQTVLFLPCLAVRAWLIQKEGRVVWMALFASIVGFMPTILFNLTVTVPRAPLPSIIDLTVVTINGIAMRVLVAATVGAARSFSWFFRTELIHGYLWYIPYLLFTIAILAIFIRKRDYIALLVWAYTAYCIVVPIVLGGVRNPELIAAGKDINTFWGGERYFVLPLAAFYLFFFWWLTRLSHDRVLTYAGWALLLTAIMSAVASDFYDPSNATATDQQWALQSQRIKHAEGQPFANKLQVPISPGPPWKAILHIQPPNQRIAADISIMTTPAQGSFDVAGSDLAMTNIVSNTAQISVGGWATNMAGTGPADGVIIMEEDTGTILAYGKQHRSRPDIAVSTKNPDLEWTGWQITFPASSLGVGEHTLQAYVVDTALRQAFPLNNTRQIVVVADVDGIVETVQGAKDTVVQPILPAKAIRQEFVATQQNLQAVIFTLASAGNNPGGLVTFYLEQLNGPEDNQYLASTTVDATVLAENGMFVFRFPPQLHSMGTRYAVTIAAPASTPDTAVTAWMQSGNAYIEGHLTQGDQMVEGDLIFKLVYGYPVP